jgi:beta-lysine 5,6-aminomutase alpha subunit
MQTRLNLDPAVVREARALAAKAGQPIVEMARTHTTVSVERAVLRLAGLEGADADGMPWVNRLVDAVRAGRAGARRRPAGLGRCWPAATPDLGALARRRGGHGNFRLPPGRRPGPARPRKAARKGIGRIDAMPGGPSGRR